MPRRRMKTQKEKEQVTAPNLRVLIFKGSRAVNPLIDPIIKIIKNKEDIDWLSINLPPTNFIKAFESTEFAIENFHPSIAICTGDRIDMTAAAYACYINNIPIAHVYAGIRDSYPFATKDCMNRHSISLWADLVFCEDEKCRKRVELLYKLVNKRKRKKIYNVGITHLDRAEPLYSFVPKKPYILVLFNALHNKSANLREIDMLKIEIAKYSDYKKIIIGPNKDLLHEFNHAIMKNLKNAAYYNQLEHDQFLGLMERSSKFITNSSCAFYEAPHYLEKENIIIVGSRNKDRRPLTKLRTGASKRIVNILEQWLNYNQKKAMSLELV